MGSRMAPKLCRWWWCVCGGGGGQTLDDAGRKQAIQMADQMCPSSLPACLGQQAPVEPALGKRLVLLEVRRRKVPVPPSVHAAGAAPHAGAVLAGLGQHRQEVFLRGGRWQLRVGGRVCGWGENRASVWARCSGHHHVKQCTDRQPPPPA